MLSRTAVTAMKSKSTKKENQNSINKECLHNIDM